MNHADDDEGKEIELIGTFGNKKDGVSRVRRATNGSTLIIPSMHTKHDYKHNNARTQQSPNLKLMNRSSSNGFVKKTATVSFSKQNDDKPFVNITSDGVVARAPYNVDNEMERNRVMS